MIVIHKSKNILRFNLCRYKVRTTDTKTEYFVKDTLNQIYKHFGWLRWKINKVFVK